MLCRWFAFSKLRDILRFRFNAPFVCSKSYVDLLRSLFFLEFLIWSHWGPRSMLDQLVRSRLQQVWGWNSNCTLITGMLLGGIPHKVGPIHTQLYRYMWPWHLGKWILSLGMIWWRVGNSCHHFCKRQLGGLRFWGKFAKGKTFLRPWHHLGRFFPYAYPFQIEHLALSKTYLPHKWWDTIKYCFMGMFSHCYDLFGLLGLYITHVPVSWPLQ